MNAYVITGPESLIHAAFNETFEALGKGALLENTGVCPYNSLFFNCDGSYWLSASINTLNFQHHLTLPADWDKFMGILADLKNPKLPDYVKTRVGKFCKVLGRRKSEVTYELYNVYGRSWAADISGCTPITEQEFIVGGLQELAEAGYVKGAKVTVENIDPSCIGAKVIDSVKFYNRGRSSYSVEARFKKNGFVFRVVSGCHSMPVGQCTLIPTLPTTSQGIPYLRQGHQVFYGPSENSGILTVGNLRHLLKQGVTELVTKAGRLTQADLELLTK